MNNNNAISVGLWETFSKNGKKYFKGKCKIDGKDYYISLFFGNTKPKSPNFNLIISEPNTYKVEMPTFAQPMPINQPTQPAQPVSDPFASFGDIPTTSFNNFTPSDDNLPF